MIREQVITNFTKLTNFPMTEFLAEAKTFFSEDVNEIVNFFKGHSNFLDKQKVKRLNSLAEKAIIITNFFYEKKGVMKTVDYWELLDTVEEIKSKLQYYQNISKYLRSSIVKGVSRSGVVFDYTMNDQDTLESISKDFIGEKDHENDWTQHALDNDLKEQDWDIEGGEKLKLRKQLFQSNLVTSIIDNTIGEKIYGKDIKRLIELKDNDLVVLNYRETVNQTVDTLSVLKKGDIPEFPDLGIDPSLYTGENYSQLNFISISRELKRIFSSDDLFKDFEIVDIRHEEGDVFIEYKVNTKYEMTIIKNITL